MTIVETFYKMPKEIEHEIITLLETFVEILSKATDSSSISSDVFLNVYGIKRVNETLLNNAKISFLIKMFEDKAALITIGGNLIIYSENGEGKGPNGNTVNINKNLVNEVFRAHYEEPK